MLVDDVILVEVISCCVVQVNIAWIAGRGLRRVVPQSKWQGVEWGEECRVCANIEYP